MIYHPINFERVKAKFPLITNLFGNNDLRSQIKMFNKVVEAKEIQLGRFGFIKEIDNNIEVHYKILNILSYLSIDDKKFPFTVAISIFYLESLLKSLDSKKCNLSSFKELLRSPYSYENLLAELTIVEELSDISDNFSVHNPSKTASNSNYDLFAEIVGKRIHTDVKWFESSLSKNRGLDMPYIFEDLIVRDINEWVMVKLKNYVFDEDDAILAAREVLDLYQNRKEINSREYYVSNLNSSSKNVIRRGNSNKFVESISIINNPGEPTVSTICGFDMNLDIKDAIVENIKKGSKQISGNTNSNDYQTIFIGTNNFQEFRDIEICLYHRKNDYGENCGLFKEGFEHQQELSSIVFFSINYSQMDQDSYQVALKSKYYPNELNEKHSDMEEVYKLFNQNLHNKEFNLNY
ncbi:hypothetical protein [Fodinibius sp. SL11]|uniref:hypothetical protein n=1 Tax=Fodinibius sp. SL11 TaxID=3425690 RepID=UPI003F882866